jgi:hypothetical protein
MSQTKEAQAKLVVYRGWLERGQHVWSPFVIKLEARLRFAGIAYTTDAGSTRSAPKGKIPYVEFRRLQPGATAAAGSIIDSRPAFLGDSTLIIKHLVEWDVLPNINARVSPAARAQDLAIRALLEDKLYFYHVRNLPLLSGHDFPAGVNGATQRLRADLNLACRRGNGGGNTTTKCETMSCRRYPTRCALS